MAGRDDLVRLIASTKKRRQNGGGIKLAKVSGGTVDVDGRRYPFDVAVDVPVNDGDYVYVLLNDGRTRAVVVGR